MAQSLRNGSSYGLADLTIVLYVPNNPYDHLNMSLDRLVVLQQVGCQDADRKTEIHPVLENAAR